MDKNKIEPCGWLSIDYVRAWYDWKAETGVDFGALKDLFDLLQVLLPNKETPRILDLGCGPGRISKMILDAIPGATVLGVDYSSVCGQVALENVGEKNRARFEFSQRDLNMPQCIKDLGIFDAVVSSLVIHNVAAENCKPLFEDVLSVLTEGGVFLNFDHISYESPRYAQQLKCLQQDYTANVPEIIKSTAGGSKGMPLSQLCELMRQAGFESVEVFYRWLSRAVFGGYKSR